MWDVYEKTLFLLLFFVVVCNTFFLCKIRKWYKCETTLKITVFWLVFARGIYFKELTIFVNVTVVVFTFLLRAERDCELCAVGETFLQRRTGC